MITIVKGSSKLVVSKGTYEEQYKKLGYQIASKKEGATTKVAPLIEKKEEDKQETIEEDLSEKFGLKTSRKKGK